MVDEFTNFMIILIEHLLITFNYNFRIGKFSSWATKVQSKRKNSFTKNGVIKTAKLSVNNLDVLPDIEFIVGESGDEVLIQRPKEVVSSSYNRKSSEVSDGSSHFSNDAIASMNLNSGKNPVVFCGGEDLGNLKIRFSIYLLNQDDR